MLLSSGFGVIKAVGPARSEDGVQHVDASAGERDQGLVVSLSFGALAGIEGAAGGVAERAEGGLVEDALERLVAAARPVQVARAQSAVWKRRRGKGSCLLSHQWQQA